MHIIDVQLDDCESFSHVTVKMTVDEAAVIAEALASLKPEDVNRLTRWDKARYSAHAGLVLGFLDRSWKVDTPANV